MDFVDGSLYQPRSEGASRVAWKPFSPLSSTLQHAEVRPKPGPAEEIDPVRVMQRVRKGIDFAKWVPEPKGGFAVDVEVPVRRSGLEGVLAEPDTAEDGLRTISVSVLILCWTSRSLSGRTGRVGHTQRCPCCRR